MHLTLFKNISAFLSNYSSGENRSALLSTTLFSLFNSKDTIFARFLFGIRSHVDKGIRIEVNTSRVRNVGFASQCISLQEK